MLDATMVAVNGPRGEATRLDQADWATAEQQVRRPLQRIFTASRAGVLSKICRLQRLMMRSRSAVLAVRSVTEHNTGRKTAGVNGALALWPEAKGDWPVGSSTSPRAGRRCRCVGVFMPKEAVTAPPQDSGDCRPCVGGGRAQRAGAGVEAWFEPRSYGDESQGLRNEPVAEAKTHR
jgi:RNA-directed DNA polymerase